MENQEEVPGGSYNLIFYNNVGIEIVSIAVSDMAGRPIIYEGVHYVAENESAIDVDYIARIVEEEAYQIMKKKNVILLIISTILLMAAAIMVISLVTAGQDNNLKLESIDLMEGVRSERVKVTEDLDSYGLQMTDFSLRLFQNTMEPGENSLVSPLSVISALGMTVNGADGETLNQMETALGMTAGQVNEFLYSFMALIEERETNQLHLANAIWIKDDDKLTVEEAFLKTNAAYYDAGVYKAPFDETTRNDINSWVSDRTQNMIPEILNEIPEVAVSYLVNALAFEGEWENIYYDYQVREEIFTTENGEEQTVEMMRSGESRYLEDETAAGFMKYYKDRQYAFVAILPDEGVTVEEYVMGLTSERLYDLLSNPEETLVETGLPKFEMDCSYELSEALGAMGMTDAFDMGKADFSLLGAHRDWNLFVSRVLHKTFISVTEEGTRAGAATVMEAAAGAAPDPKIVFLNRPFLYLIVDSTTYTPIFMGSMMNAA